MGSYRLRLNWKTGNRTKIVGQKTRLSAQTHRVPVVWPVLHDNNKCTGNVHGSEVVLKPHR